MGEGEGGGELGQFGPPLPPSSPTRGEEVFLDLWSNLRDKLSDCIV